jgi:hypothetical protein
MRRMRVGTVAIGIVAVVALSGCTTGVATKVPIPTATASAAPTPTSPALTAPQPRVTVPCSGLVDAPALSAIASGIALTVPPGGPYPESAAAEQAGLLNCQWNRPGQAQYALSISVLADARAGYDQSPVPGSSPLGLGSESSYSCADPGFSISCTASILVGRYWAYVLVGDTGRSAVQSSDILRGVARSLVTHLTQAGDPAPAWTMPTTAWSPVKTCTQLGAAVSMADVFASASVAIGVGDWNGSGNEDLAWEWTVSPSSSSSYYNCAWQGDSSSNPALVVAQVVPGAEWIWNQLAAVPNVTSTKISVPRATAAYYRCDAHGYCWADAMADHSWIQVTLTNSNSPGEEATLTKALTDLSAFNGA